MVQAYFVTLRKILTSPTEFFRRMSVTGGFSEPLAFALVTHWIGTTLAFLWKLLFKSNDAFYSNSWSSWMGLPHTEYRTLSWFFGVGAIVLDPFMTLLLIFVSSFLVFIGARLFVSPARAGSLHEVTYESATRLVCFSLAASIFLVIPFLGKGISAIYLFVLSIIGAREIYQVSTLRAAIIALFPNLLIFAIILIGLLLFIVTTSLFKFLF